MNWQRTPREIFGDDMTEYLDDLSRVCEKLYGVPLEQTYTTDSEDDIRVKEIFLDNERIPYTEEELRNDNWGLFTMEYNGSVILCSCLDGIYWMVCDKQVML